MYSPRILISKPSLSIPTPNLPAPLSPSSLSPRIQTPNKSKDRRRHAMENQPADPVQGPLPPPARAARRRVIWFEAYQYIKTERVGLPIPKKAPKIEATQFPFVKKRDATGDDLVDCLKMTAFGIEDLIGDKRRQILHLLPMDKKNRQHITTLGNQLSKLNGKLAKKIKELERDCGITLEVPFHFRNFPALEA